MKRAKAKIMFEKQIAEWKKRVISEDKQAKIIKTANDRCEELKDQEYDGTN